MTGWIAEAFDLEAAIWSVAILTLGSGAIVAVRMRETHTPAKEPTKRVETHHSKGLLGTVDSLTGTTLTAV